MDLKNDQNSSTHSKASSSKSDQGPDSGSSHGSQAQAPMPLFLLDDGNSPQSSPSKASPQQSQSPPPPSSPPPPESSPSPPPPPPSPPHHWPPPSSPPPSPSPSPPPPPPSPTPSPPPPPPSPSPSPPPPSPPSPASSHVDSPSPRQSPSTHSDDSPSPDKPTPPPPSPRDVSGTSNESPPLPSPGDVSTRNGSSPPKTLSSPTPPMASGHPPLAHSPGMSSGFGTHSKSPRVSSDNSSPSTSGGGSDNNSVKYFGYILAGAFMVAIVAVVLVLLFRRKNKRGDVYVSSYLPPPNNFPMEAGVDVHYYGQQPSILNRPQDGFYNSQHPQSPDTGPKSAQIAFSFEKIVEITNGFSSQYVIGKGGFGCVYKASLPDGRAVAVKQLKAGSGQGEREFRAEMEIISRVHHRHLVSLVGYCISEQQRVLIYEFVPNGTLDRHLHGNGMPVLDWAKRLKIAIGAAKGLAYLHEDCHPKIIHRDIKSANILLDNAYEAQVSDFGLAKLTDDANTHISTRVVGTFGYMAPEYATSGKLTDRSDVFSFGVVLLELVTGRKPVDQTQPVGDESLVEWARPLLLRAVETGDFKELVDPRLERHYVESEMLRMIEAAAACVRHSAPNRPRMVQVVRALDSGDQPADLSNGMKYGQSIVYDSAQYNEDIMRFRRMNNRSCDDSEYDMYSGEYGSSSLSGSQHAWVRGSLSGESEYRALNTSSNSTEDRYFRQCS